MPSRPLALQGPYASLGHERRERGAFRTMFESEERVLYFLNFNKPGATNLWYKVNATALHALREAEKPAYVVCRGVRAERRPGVR